jgi:hypothetical protein
MIQILNAVENIFESSQVYVQPEKIQAILKWTKKKKEGASSSRHFYTILNKYLAVGDKQHFSNKVHFEH